MKKFVVLILMSIAGHQGMAQATNMNAMTFPSANNTFSGKIGTAETGTNVTVDLYTGTALVNVNICNVASRELSIPVGLSYTGGRGIKVQDYAGVAGLGWQLNAGGSITRVVRGFPDEQSNGYITGGWSSVIDGWAGWSTANFGSLTQAQGLALTGVNNNNIPTADGEPDLFFIKTPFFSFQFVFDGNFSNPVIDNNNGMSIQFNPTAQSFVVTDDKGNKYYFGSLEATTTKLYTTNAFFVTTWYLDKIVSFNSKDVINFTYTSGGTHNDVLTHYQFTESVNAALAKQMETTPQTSTIQAPLYVSSIVTSLGEADFSYVWDRQDDAQAARLSSVVLKAYNPVSGTNNTTLQTYTFNISYFGTPSADPNVLRLRLDNIQVTGNTTETATPLTLQTFTYNQDHVMPSRSDAAFDYWGYMSTTSTSVYYTTPTDYWTNAYAIRQVNTAMAKTYILQTIDDLPGGKWQITYESNDYYASGTTLLGGFRVQQLSRTYPTTGQSINTTYSYLNSSNQSSGAIFSTAYNQINFNFTNAFLYFSESPYLTSDINGNFVGYSMVTETNQNGGSTVHTFYNFNDPGCGDVTTSTMPGSSSSFLFSSSTSQAYKRGLPNVETVYAATGEKVKQTIYAYGSQATVTQLAKAYRPFNIGAVVNNMGGSQQGWSTYCTNKDNYRLTQTTQRDFDRLNNAVYVERVTNYTYSSVNHRLVSRATTTDAKGQTLDQYFYYPDDGTNVPGVSGNSSETAALSAMTAANFTSVMVDEKDIRNGATRELHNVFTGISTGISTNVYQTAVNNYSGGTLVRQQLFTVDPSNSQPIASNMTGDKSTALLFDYNTSYPVAKVENATASASYSTSQGTQTTTAGMLPATINFTVDYTGSVTLQLTAGSVSVNYNLTGPSPRNGLLCYGSSCGAYTPSNTFTNMPPGNYSLSLNFASGTGSAIVNCTFPHVNSNYSFSREFFYEGFESRTPLLTGTAHTGKNYWNNDYAVNFTPPNSRAYTIQWWSQVNGAWVFHQQPFVQGLVLTAPVDDIRIFPSDALMSTYTYSPFFGKTSEIDPSGQTKTYEYDGLGRLVRERDQNGNLLKQYDYKYQASLHQ